MKQFLDITSVNSMNKEMTLSAKPKPLKIIFVVPMMIMKLFSVAFTEFAGILRAFSFTYSQAGFLTSYRVSYGKIVPSEIFPLGKTAVCRVIAFQDLMNTLATNSKRFTNCTIT